ncbi:6-phosphogluconolactonase [Allopusillimonas soli]|uniref:6-phosphogluconolactonase n=1 Tax=Allopusillimonas soli TaxID=659016 RepID=A0A853FE60_9BURK|nr:6-phosphogluconolactonase [Allopusillimonas soli]NYT38217.1 6-phosphogluconolactonase [Allopusillimonas soli]TEA72203.1 6-phosphogluconolactonase [Allopusillimonas soli]
MWREFESSVDCARALATDIGTRLERVVERNGSAGLAVSGGRSPIALFETLSGLDLPWAAINISLVDERFVPTDSEDSNEHLVRTHLLRGSAAHAHFTGLVTDADDLAHSLETANLAEGDPAVVVLGMGDDGHTASLFPGAPQLPQGLDPRSPQRYVHITPPHAPHERISMTLRAILSARRIILLISGAHKREVLGRAATGPDPALPVSYVINQTGVPFDVYWHA